MSGVINHEGFLYARFYVRKVYGMVGIGSRKDRAKDPGLIAARRGSPSVLCRRTYPSPASTLPPRRPWKIMENKEIGFRCTISPNPASLITTLWRKFVKVFRAYKVDNLFKFK